jgi:hypothetical protein
MQEEGRGDMHGRSTRTHTQTLACFPFCVLCFDVGRRAYCRRAPLEPESESRFFLVNNTSRRVSFPASALKFILLSCDVM